MRQPTMLSLEEYLTMSEQLKASYLDNYITEERNLTEDFLISALSVEQTALAKWFLVKALGIMRSTQGIPHILNVCKDADIDFDHTSLHAISAWSLGKIGLSAFGPVMELLDESNVETRKCAVDALGEIGSPLAIDALCHHLKKDEVQVQSWAALSLSKIGNAALPCLHKVIVGANLRTRLIALDAILKIGCGESLATIIECLHAGSEEEKIFILQRAEKFYEMMKVEIKSLATGYGDTAGLARSILRSGL
jgi:HEAT repeat protein